MYRQEYRKYPAAWNSQLARHDCWCQVHGQEQRELENTPVLCLCDLASKLYKLLMNFIYISECFLSTCISSQSQSVLVCIFCCHVQAASLCSCGTNAQLKRNSKKVDPFSFLAPPDQLQCKFMYISLHEKVLVQDTCVAVCRSSHFGCHTMHEMFAHVLVP